MSVHLPLPRSLVLQECYSAKTGCTMQAVSVIEVNKAAIYRIVTTGDERSFITSEIECQVCDLLRFGHTAYRLCFR